MNLNPTHLRQWIEQNRDKLKPPVGNQCLYPVNDFIVMMVAGPNQRKDFHVNQGEEIFYQLEGDIELLVMDEGKRKSIPIRAGELYLLPANTPHSPQRPEGTIGMVIERARGETEEDTFRWYCDECQHQMYEETAVITDIVAQLPVIFDHFYNDPTHATCSECGWKATR